MVSMEVEDDPVDTVQCTRESQETDIYIKDSRCGE